MLSKLNIVFESFRLNLQLDYSNDADWNDWNEHGFVDILATYGKVAMSSSRDHHGIQRHFQGPVSVPLAPFQSQVRQQPCRPLATGLAAGAFQSPVPLPMAQLTNHCPSPPAELFVTPLTNTFDTGTDLEMSVAGHDLLDLGGWDELMGDPEPAIEVSRQSIPTVCEPAVTQNLTKSNVCLNRRCHLRHLSMRAAAGGRQKNLNQPWTKVLSNQERPW